MYLNLIIYFFIIICINNVFSEQEYFIQKYLMMQDKQDMQEGCRYRDLPILPQKVFYAYATFGCVYFTKAELFVNQMNVATCGMDNYVVPGIIINEVCHPFDHENENIQKEIEYYFQNEQIVNRWYECTLEAINCCDNVLIHYTDKDNYCPAVWDGWTCFNGEARGSIQEQLCSPFYYYTQVPQCHHYSRKECTLNSTWITTTDYTGCSIVPRLKTRTRWHIAMLSISIICCAPAIFILIFNKTLQSEKFKVIRNLLIAIVFRNICILITKSEIIMEELTNSTESVMTLNHWPCKFLAFFEKLATNAVFTCMLLEGIYLHRLLTNVFASRTQSGIKMLYFNIIGASLSLIMALAWSITMAIRADQYCWVVIDGVYYHWINDSLRLTMLIINIFLLSHIILILWKTYNNRPNEDHPALRTVKASLFCMPVFGIPFLFFIVYPNTTSCGLEQFYYFCSYAFEGLQGLLVATLHCYVDKEVIKLITRSYNNIKYKLSLRKSSSMGDDRRVTWTTDRRSTHITAVDNNSTTRNNETENNSSNPEPPPTSIDTDNAAAIATSNVSTINYSKNKNIKCQPSAVDNSIKTNDSQC